VTVALPARRRLVLHFEHGVAEDVLGDLAAAQGDVLLVPHLSPLHGAAGAQSGPDIFGDVPPLQQTVDLGEDLEALLQLLVVRQGL